MLSTRLTKGKEIQLRIQFRYTIYFRLQPVLSFIFFLWVCSFIEPRLLFVDMVLHRWFYVIKVDIEDLNEFHLLSGRPLKRKRRWWWTVHIVAYIWTVLLFRCANNRAIQWHFFDIFGRHSFEEYLRVFILISHLCVCLVIHTHTHTHSHQPAPTNTTDH